MKGGIGLPFFMQKKRAIHSASPDFPILGLHRQTSQQELLLVDDVAEQSDNYKRVYVRTSQEFVRFDVQKTCHIISCQMIYI
jgi:hypothetical protein